MYISIIAAGPGFLECIKVCVCVCGGGGGGGGGGLVALLILSHFS